VLGNIPVGDGSVINAGSVVTKAVSAYTRVGGVPARPIATFSVNDTYIAEIAQRNYEEEESASAFDLPKAFINYHRELS
jgi:serine acetyltransferase